MAFDLRPPPCSSLLLLAHRALIQESVDVPFSGLLRLGGVRWAHSGTRGNGGDSEHGITRAGKQSNGGDPDSQASEGGGEVGMQLRQRDEQTEHVIEISS
jgi:hypothetical protein